MKEQWTRRSGKRQGSPSQLEDGQTRVLDSNSSTDRQIRFGASSNNPSCFEAHAKSIWLSKKRFCLQPFDDLLDLSPKQLIWSEVRLRVNNGG